MSMAIYKPDSGHPGRHLNVIWAEPVPLTGTVHWRCFPWQLGSRSVTSGQTIAIVGANLAGGRAAEALRQAGFGGRVLLIGAEDDPPYERPPLSKEILKGTMLAERTYLRPAWHLGRGRHRAAAGYHGDPDQTG